MLTSVEMGTTGHKVNYVQKWAILSREGESKDVIGSLVQFPGDVREGHLRNLLDHMEITRHVWWVKFATPILTHPHTFAIHIISSRSRIAFGSSMQPTYAGYREVCLLSDFRVTR